MATITLTVDRAESDALRELVHWDETDFEGITHAIREGRQDEAREFQAKVDLVLSVLDGIGWQDDDRTGCEITCESEGLVAWLRAKRRDWKLFIAENTVSLLNQEDGVTGHYCDGMTQAESVADSHRRITKDERTLAAVDKLPGRFREPAGAVA